MIEGWIGRDFRPYVAINFLKSDGSWRSVDVLVDSGFNGYVGLPSAEVRCLDLQESEIDLTFEYGDGRDSKPATYEGVMEFDGRESPVLIADVARGTAKIGTELMAGYSIRVDLQPNGKVELKPIDG